MLKIVEKRIRGGLCYSTNRCVSDLNKYMKDYDKNKEPSYLKYWSVNNLYDCAISQILPVITLNGLKIFLNSVKAL